MWLEFMVKLKKDERDKPKSFVCAMWKSFPKSVGCICAGASVTFIRTLEIFFLSLNLSMGGADGKHRSNSEKTPKLDGVLITML